jgi:hypothetical protein
MRPHRDVPKALKISSGTRNCIGGQPLSTSILLAATKSDLHEQHGVT